MNFISLEQVIAILEKYGSPESLQRVKSLFSFPAPNPTEAGGRNVMGQTEDEFWNAVEAQDASAPPEPEPSSDRGNDYTTPCN